MSVARLLDPRPPAPADAMLAAICVDKTFGQRREMGKIGFRETYFVL
jgi:hypothetical protein